MKMVPPKIDDDRIGKGVRWVPDEGLPVGRYLLILVVSVAAVSLVVFSFPPIP